MNDYGGIFFGNYFNETAMPKMEDIHVISSETRLICDIKTESSKPNKEYYLAVSKTNYDAFVAALKVMFPYSANNSFNLTESNEVYTFTYSGKTVKLVCLENVTSSTEATAGLQVGSWKYDATVGTFVYQN